MQHISSHRSSEKASWLTNYGWARLETFSALLSPFSHFSFLYLGKNETILIPKWANFFLHEMFAILLNIFVLEYCSTKSYKNYLDI